MIRKEAVTAVLGSPIAYYTVFAKVLGCVEAGVFASQMFYWYGKGHDPDGWIYKTQDDIYEETGLTRRNQEMARRKMRQAGVLEEVKRGVPAKLYYRLNLERLFELVQDDLLPDESADAEDDDEEERGAATPTPPPRGQSPEKNSTAGDVTNKDVQSVHSRMSKTRILERPNRTSLNVQSAQAEMREMDIQESAKWPDKHVQNGHTNTETTAKITSKTTTENTHGSGGDGHTPTVNGVVSNARVREMDMTTRKKIAQTARSIMQNLPHTWRNAGRYVDSASDEQLQVLLTWLWLWRLTTPPENEYDTSAWQDYEDVKTFYGEPFAGLENIPGYIRTRVDENEAAELHEADLTALFEAVGIDNELH